jgi:hypothetical protein
MKKWMSFLVIAGLSVGAAATVWSAVQTDRLTDSPSSMSQSRFGRFQRPEKDWTGMHSHFRFHCPVFGHRTRYMERPCWRGETD